MDIIGDEYRTAEQLKRTFLEHKHLLDYANVRSDDTYAGWVTDFRLRDGSGQKIHLDLRNSDDLFLLFVLAVVWSRTGPWENSAFFVSYLKIHEKHRPTFWIEKENCEAEGELSVLASLKIIKLVNGIDARKRISFRQDIYDSVHVLATNWENILASLDQSERENNFELFMTQIRTITGLGTGNKRMLIKIPLILRELRCQNIYQNIPGDYCCVPDKRVKDAANALYIRLPISTTITGLKASSAKIYSLFGDLYDLPLFAYADLMPKT